MKPMLDNVEVLRNRMEMHRRRAFLSSALAAVSMVDPYSLAGKSVKDKLSNGNLYYSSGRNRNVDQFVQSKLINRLPALVPNINLYEMSSPRHLNLHDHNEMQPTHCQTLCALSHNPDQLERHHLKFRAAEIFTTIN